jgi:hypothetical protein
MLAHKVLAPVLKRINGKEGETLQQFDDFVCVVTDVLPDLLGWI